MIQLANDPSASRMGWRPTAQAGKESPAGGFKGRPGHPWPFLSKQVQRPEARTEPMNPRNDSGS